MEVGKRGAKGGFFQLFDWNTKSRKKLFSSKSELPDAESSNQSEENFHGSAISRFQLGLENGFSPNARVHNDYHYTLSLSGDSEYGTKAPGVVARLMGLDSLPTSNVNEPCFTPVMESHSFRDSSYLRAAPESQSEHDIVIFESVRNKLDGLTRNPLDLSMSKVQSGPYERFRREVLPPKSAKPISITHHRLLSPIKSPGFIPLKNAAYIMEAAAKIIEQSPRSTIKGKLPLLASSSAPFRIRDFKERMEAAQRSSRPVDVSKKGKEQNSIKNMKKQLSTGGHCRSEDSCLYKGSEEAKRVRKQVNGGGQGQLEGIYLYKDSEESKRMKKKVSARGQGLSEDSCLYKGSEESKMVGSQRLKSKEKSVSLAVQAKANSQKRDLTSVSSRNSEKQKDHSDAKPRLLSRNIPNSQKKAEKQSSSRRPSEVLGLNHQKQNCAYVKDGENFVPSFPGLKERKESNFSTNYINGRASKTVNKVVVNDVVISRKANITAVDPEKLMASSKTNSLEKKLSILGNVQSDGSVSQKALGMKDEKSIKCNFEFEGNSKWDVVDKNSLDVVSFTFTSPIKKSGAGSSLRDTTHEVTNSFSPSPHVCESDLGNSSAVSSGCDVIGGDALSVLLEQKLKELTSRVELSQLDLSEFSSSNTSYGSITTVNLVNLLPMNDDLCKGSQEIQNASDCAPVNKSFLKTEKESKGLEDMDEENSNGNIEQPRYLHSLVSDSFSRQPSFSGSSCDTFDVGRSMANEGRIQCLSLEPYEGMKWSCTRKSHLSEGDMEMSDTASSLSVGTISETVVSGLYATDFKDTSYWELKYIGDILNGSELMLEDFALGRVHKIIAPDLFNHLEDEITGSNKVREECYVLERKVLFDCVSECLEIKSKRLLSGSYKVWVKQMSFFCRKQWLVEELYREISSCTNTEELMVDELVDKEMSSKNGKWVDFEMEAFQEGVEIEEKILISLVDEVIDDFFF